MNLNEKIRASINVKNGVQAISLTRLMALHDSYEVYTVRGVDFVESNEKKGFLWRLVDSNGECYTTKSCFELDVIAKEVIFAGNEEETAANIADLDAGNIKVIFNSESDCYGQTFIRVKFVD